MKTLKKKFAIYARCPIDHELYLLHYIHIFNYKGMRNLTQKLYKNEQEARSILYLIVGKCKRMRDYEYIITDQPQEINGALAYMKGDNQED